jgi:hypothetical protein
MTGLLLILAALVCAMVGSELALRGTKLQTGLVRVMIVWGGVYLVGVYPLLRWGDTGPVVFTIFWGGAFLSWFGVRSHVESSILLRMLYLLRRQPMPEARLLDEYEAHYGQATRVEELVRGGLVSRNGEQLLVTPKGKRILRVAAKLR